MILSDLEIQHEIEAGNIVVEPFRPDCLGSNSYDVHLSRYLAVYSVPELDSRKHNPTLEFEIPEEGFVLQPNVLYLGSTEEYTETHGYVPFLEGKSSIGRLGIDIHPTAGKGDAGFCNHWTLEISVVLPVRVYAGMPVGQLIYFAIQGEVRTSYQHKTSAKYQGRNPKPVESMMWKNKF
jgi:dCTP deaminase